MVQGEQPFDRLTVAIAFKGHCPVSWCVKTPYPPLIHPDLKNHREPTGAFSRAYQGHQEGSIYQVLQLSSKDYRRYYRHQFVGPLSNPFGLIY